MPARSAPARSAPARRPQVFVAGDLHNLGDLKLTLQNLALTQGRGGAVRRWAGLPEAIERQVEEAGGTLVPGKQIVAFARRVWGAELVLGGGQIVRDNVSAASLAGLALAALAAVLGGGTVTTRGLGVSVIRSPLRRFLWRAVLRRCAIVNVRDDISKLNLAALLPGKAVAVTADMVFFPTVSPLAGDDPGEEEGAGDEAGDRRRWVVVAPCDDAGEGRVLDTALLDAMIAAALAALPGARLAIACHDPRESMDRAAAARIAARWSASAPRIVDSFELAVLTRLYRQAGLVLTNRLHSLIFAVIAGAPVLGIGDGTSKVRVVAGEFAIPVAQPGEAAQAADLVAQALGFDAEARTARRHDMASRATRNLIAPPAPPRRA
ncbi:polysaccharide pyruvyl transferase family protein [Novosphingobium guangzhouense]|uniref:Polysaccharide pyruvyl transferase n=1 Tax=Novosphingobium guangzhouense TaxID=1850347 RepID=A0A2K2G155_9SPHN|nr:polysaccharide pyruvyl transferase family protein [Novosphingobium guangzhouense]PNU04776.1 polysaccharide pyruvyl transferase [Novosphingobium guangzhouense]